MGVRGISSMPAGRAPECCDTGAMPAGLRYDALQEGAEHFLKGQDDVVLVLLG